MGVGVDFSDDHVRHELRVVRRGQLAFVSLRELEHWLAARATSWSDPAPERSFFGR